MPAKWLKYFIISLLLYAVSSFYIAWRGWQALSLYTPALTSDWYIVLMITLTAAYPIGRFAEKAIPLWLSNQLTVIGSYWLAFFYYLLLLTALSDLCLWIAAMVAMPAAPVLAPGAAMPAIAGIALLLFFYGIYNANTPVIRKYEVTINKSSNRQMLHIVMVSDIHLGKIVTSSRLQQLVERINALQPDLILLPGDIIDEDVDLFIDKNMAAILAQLSAPLGAFGVLGNHEYIGGKSEEAIQELKRGGITILRDAAVKIDDSFYLVGRDDYSRNRFDGLLRAPLTTILKTIDTELPIILMDHQPAKLIEAQTNGVDLQLSGHTHRGQMSPNHLITRSLYEVDWGYLRKDSLQVIVSCGYGTWGPPIRIGNRPEIVDLYIHFKP